MEQGKNTESAEAKAEATEAKAEDTGANVEESKLATDAQANAEASSSEQESPSERLLKESKAWKAKAVEAQKELERIREAEKKRQGKYQELADEYKAKLDNLEKKIIKQKVQTALMQAAPKYGYAGKSPDTLLKLGDASLLQYDETSEEVVGIDIYLDSLKKAEPTLFRNVDAKINDKAPSVDSVVAKKTPSTWNDKYVDLRQKLAESLQKGV